MDFETISKRFKEGKKVKIYLVDRTNQYLLAGYINKIYNHGKNKTVDLHPFVGISGNGYNNLGIFGLLLARKNETVDDLISSFPGKDIVGPNYNTVDFTTRFNIHKKYASKLLEKICDIKEPKVSKTLTKYFHRAKTI